MTDDEFNILDELYFVTSYQNLKDGSELDNKSLQQNLISMVGAGLVRVYKNVDEASELSEINMSDHFKSYFYLASKKGLLEHNSK